MSWRRGATHPCSKCDRLGLIWGRSQSWCKYEKDAINNFARELVKYEQMRRVLPHQRHTAPLVLSPDGTTPWRKPALDTFFKALLRAVVTPEEKTRYSLHSFTAGGQGRQGDHQADAPLAQR